MSLLLKLLWLAFVLVLLMQEVLGLLECTRAQGAPVQLALAVLGRCCFENRTFPKGTNYGHLHAKRVSASVWGEGGKERKGRGCSIESKEVTLSGCVRVAMLERVCMGLL